ncbi:hypothetical protein PG985_012212 [Apiospora marii]|uniref:uncharacterized protein n=1 Tax=Apiospora marii TaxID=335849 RepID=UPI0031301CEB
MSWSSSLSSNAAPTPIPWAQASFPFVAPIDTFVAEQASSSSSPESQSGSDNDQLVIRPDVTAFAAPSTSCSQLLSCTRRLNSTLNAHHTVDAASQAYNTLGETPRLLCEALLKPPSEVPILGPLSDLAGLENSFNSLSLDLSDHGGQSKGKNLARHNEQGNASAYFPEKYLEAMRGWKTCLRDLHDRLQASLLSTYSTYEEEVTSSMAEQLFNSDVFRAEAVQRMKQAKSPSSRSTRGDDGLPTFETRFCTYESVRQDLAYVHSLLQLGESGISLGRATQDITISERGDAVLEFANNESDSHPVLRFRVLSHMLSETSPLFARIFESVVGGDDSGDVLKEGFVPGLPQSPVEYTWCDGAQTKLYRMPQLELNAHGSFELLLHAAHLHNQSIPREIEFETFVALAKACMRYQCTSPVEMFVEYRWLPQWMHKAIDDMPDGLLLISYAFGLRRLFTRMSKTAILNVVDEDDLQAKPWPQKMKDRIWAVRRAKMDQVFTCCSSALQEYLRGPTTPSGTGDGSDDGGYDKIPAMGVGVVPSSKPRCPKGNQWCDAMNLGWLMLVFAQQQILPHIMQSPAVAHLPPPPGRSLNQIFDSLRAIVSTPQGHGGVCEYAPVFRSAINDIYNSVQGLTLFEVNGQHGWALSRHKIDLPQITFTATKIASPPAAAAAAATFAPTTAAEARETAMAKVAFRIMEYVDDPRDLRSVAMVSKAFYAAYYANAGDLSQRMAAAGSKDVMAPALSNSHEERALMNHETGITNNDLPKNLAVFEADDGFRRDQQKVLVIDDGDEEDADDNSTTGDHDHFFTLPPSDVHDDDRQQQRTTKVLRAESERLLWAAQDNNADHNPPGPAVSLYPTKLLDSATTVSGSTGNSSDGRAPQIGQVWKPRNEEGTEKFLASEVALHFAAVTAAAAVAVPIEVAPPVEDKNLVVMEDKNLREQRDRKVGILF